MLDVEATEMTIHVVSQNTNEREAETRALFQKCKPYLDEGYCLSRAVMLVKGIKYQSFGRYHWYQELKKYAESQGYRSRK